MNFQNKENNENLFDEIREISKNLNNIRQRITSEQVEFLKCERILQERANTLLQLNEAKFKLKQDRNTVLLKMGRDSEEEDENHESLVNRKAKPPDLPDRSSLSSSTNSFDNFSERLRSSQSSYSTSLDNTINEIILNSKRKPEPVTLVENNKIQRLESTRQFFQIFELESGELSCIYFCDHGILLGGSNGLLQLRNHRTYDIMRIYEGHGHNTVEKIGIIPRGEHIIIASCSRRRFLAFDLQSGEVLRTMDLDEDIVSLKSLRRGIFVTTRTAQSLLLTNINLSLFASVNSTNQVVTAFDPMLKNQNEVGLVYSCGTVYKRNLAKDPPELEVCFPKSRENVLGFMFLPTHKYRLSYTASTVTVSNAKNTSQFERTFDPQIIKVCLSSCKIFVMLADGKVLVFPIVGNLCKFDWFQTYDTQDWTLRDMFVLGIRVYLIGARKVYELK